MKRIAIFILCLAVTMTLCSCGNRSDKKDDNNKANATIPSISVQGENSSEGTITTATPDPAPSKEATDTTQATQPVETVKNELNQDWKKEFIHNGEWSIYLGHAHWENDQLAISVYITNGMDQDITLNRHDVVIIKDSKGNIIARAQLDLTNYAVKYNEHNTITVTLPGDTILMPGANLNDPGLDIYFVTNDYLCQPCNGSGVISNRVACAICGGVGQQYIPNQYYDTALNMWMGGYIACSGCGGSGYINAGNTTCSHCGGDGLTF